MILDINILENVVIFTLVLLGVDHFKKFILKVFTEKITSYEDLPAHLQEVITTLEKNFDNFTFRTGRPFFGVFYDFNYFKLKADYTITINDKTKKSDFIYWINKVESNYFEDIKPIIFFSYFILIELSYFKFSNFFTFLQLGFCIW